MPLHATHLMNAFLLAIVLILLLRAVAWPLGLIDKPDSRKQHHGGVPVVGGIAMFLALLLTACLVDGLLETRWPLLAGLAILVGLGVMDDRFNLRAPLRLAVQITAALIIVAPGSHLITDLGDVIGFGLGASPGGERALELGIFAMPFTLIFMVGVINALNMIDGLDGLAGGVAASAFFWLAVAGAFSDAGSATLPLLLLCVTAGFLLFNLRHPWQARARVFMGDAGSTMLGASIAFLTIDAATGPARLAPLPAWLWLCALPAIDTLSLIVRRLMVGQSPMASDRRHLHHLLLEAGLSARAATTTIVMVSFLLGGIGMLGVWLGMSTHVMVLGLVLVVGLHVFFVGHHEHRVARRNAGAATPAADPVMSSQPVRKRLS
ncbi:MAG: undecaprenyl/decaprenyl-phosphate alpha-N-acetylglucosaminyl 1-phosphate transferase [Chelatococcus sp.]|uniref:MraY family glycosyltransferase n=1 Tax=unclassified Chelatococcus TaxID=2638111 RepID=UPI001BCD2FB9|nr:MULTISPECIES: MraY family glycosyltransferase [unclassified Chelatococcus]CAH1650129.1 Undecaprenyl-phosphate N-acetylglucosaminyl 1-phosphate transferase [Hyphomicrobiales bacterium]MBS7739694.1 undecaprenyl/decaprenyl-phosphate alpha-N-acetylglucosaminyl 1-phosphate transferase [Chelatococcus sp. HY11]MBX3540066.1 undecaprenyl/decaprenyl-phosphate alpha-N-acetylglucosaminyl 1-phosphate transferase [Chelatococcus sp.]MBX3544063.1 undecaprenyl/decaprenyl-phosphate alpha-N-acetylglucosaminyl 